ncbi:hypothetical protein O3P69_018665 [Scylla paramamosain]|uniref:Uncharacterized protein n=1 Tax=Scylla paramamosain TaxID=85552 RepID=A0AAW0SG99_SCYPA
MKKANVERHYSSKHAKLSDLGGQMRLDKINALRRCLESQQASFTRPRCDRDNVIQTSYALSDLIAKKLKPHIEGEFVKECIVKAAEGLNSRQFKELLNDLASEYGDLVYHCEVRWLSRGKMLMRFYELRDEVKQFMEMKEHLRHALKYASVFGTTYCCEQFFSKLTLAKSRLRSRLTDANLENQLRVASSTVPT